MLLFVVSQWWLFHFGNPRCLDCNTTSCRKYTASCRSYQGQIPKKVPASNRLSTSRPSGTCRTRRSRASLLRAGARELRISKEFGCRLNILTLRDTASTAIRILCHFPYSGSLFLFPPFRVRMVRRGSRRRIPGLSGRPRRTAFSTVEDCRGKCGRRPGGWVGSFL